LVGLPLLEQTSLEGMRKAQGAPQNRIGCHFPAPALQLGSKLDPGGDLESLRLSALVDDTLTLD